MHSTREPSKAIIPVVALSLMTVISAVAGLMVSLPSIAVETGATQTQLTWIVDAYTVVFAGLLLRAGAIADRHGRRKVLVIGLAIYVLANIAGLAISDASQLIGIRAITGIGAAFIMPSTLAVITTSFTGEERSKAVGVWVGVAGGGAFVGLFGTALLLRYWSWHSFFALNLVLATIALVGTLRVIPESRDTSGAAVDPVGGVLSIVAVASLVFGIIEGPERGWSDVLTVGGLGLGIVGFIAFVFYELRHAHPLLDPRLFRDRGFSAGALAITIQFFCQFGFIFVVLQYLQYVVNFSAWDATIRLLIIPIIVLPASRVAGKLAARIPQKRMGPVGMALFGVGMFIFSTMTSEFSLAHFWIGLLFMGFGMAISMVPATTAITSSLSLEKQGVASAVNDVSRELGSAIGIAIMGSALNSTYRASLDPTLTKLPPDFAERLRSSVAFVKIDPAVIAAKFPQAKSLLGMWDQLVAAGRAAFTDGMHVALYIAGGTAFVAAVLVAVLAPARMNRENL